MHLADAFIQSDLHCIQVTVLSALAFPGNRTHDLSAMLYHLSYRKAKQHIALINVLQRNPNAE